MQIEMMKTADLIPYVNNPRNNDAAVDAVASSIKNFGFKVPIVIDSKREIITGHTRLKAAKKLGMDEVPVIRADDLTPAQVKAFRLADNKVAELAEWDDDLLSIELDGIDDIDMTEFGFDIPEEAQEEPAEEIRALLADRFVVPPFSVLDTAQGYWQERKQALNKFLQSTSGRTENLIGMSASLKYMCGGKEKNDTSEFDPVLCEVLERWFCIEGGQVFDPFAGGSTRGCISELIGNKYVGIDLSEKQIKANQETATKLKVTPTYYCDDSQNMDNYVADETVDMVLTCPPYFDLEVYSDKENDISNMTYDDFQKAYEKIISGACHKLKSNRFIAVVISNVRNAKTGEYRNLVGETISAMEKGGCIFYNEIILKRASGNGAFRAAKQMNATRKPVRIHENIVVGYKPTEEEKKLMEQFKDDHQITQTHDSIIVGYKGDQKDIKNEFGAVDFSDIEIDDLIQETLN